MRHAVIDIGTNTILMLVAEVLPNGSMTVLTDEHFIARLGKGVDAGRIISSETFNRVRDILLTLKNIANSFGVNRPVAFGTSALRDATNRNEFIEFIRQELSIDIQIIHGDEEAKCSYYGAISDLTNQYENNKFAVLDIGGGSTELVIGNKYEIYSSTSIDIGSVRLTERILKTSPPNIYAIYEAIELIKTKIDKLPKLTKDTILIGVAGTLTTLASLNLNLMEYNSAKVHHHILTFKTIEEIFDKLKVLSMQQLRNIPQIHPMRADVILAGVLILIEILKKIEVEKITVSDRGLRYGLLLKVMNK